MDENTYCLKATLIIKSDHESMLEVSRWVLVKNQQFFGD